MQTMPDWNEWSKELTEEQRMYSLYKILCELTEQMIQRDNVCAAREKICSAHFEKIEERRWFDRVASFLGGIVGGVATMLGLKIGGGL